MQYVVKPTIVLGLVLVLVSPAAAQTSTPTQAPSQPSSSQGSGVPAGYREAIALGLQEFERGFYAEARTRFLEAHRIYPSARTLRVLGKVEYELRHYAAALDYFEASLASRDRPLTEAMRAEVERLIEMTRDYLATLTVQVSPPGASLELDGRPVERGPDGKLTAEVGDHTLRAHAEGYEPETLRVTVRGRDARSVELVLQPLGQRSDERARARRRRWGWSVVSIVVAGAAVGLAVGLSGRESEGSLPDDTNLPGREGTPIMAARTWGW